MQLKNRFWGSTTALVLGALSIVSGLSMAGQGQNNTNVEAGMAMLFGALAYRSLKKRSLGLKKTTTSSLIVEYVYLALVAVVILLGVMAGLLYQNPFTYMFLPLWSFGAYFVAGMMNKEARKKE